MSLKTFWAASLKPLGQLGECVDPTGTNFEYSVSFTTHIFFTHFSKPCQNPLPLQII